METIGGPTGLKAGAMVREALEERLAVRPTAPIICPRGCGPMRVESYVVLRPDEARCDSCGEAWRDEKVREQVCSACGYDPAEGLGCVAHEPQ